MPEEQVRQKLQFEDIALLTDRDIRGLLREVDKKDLAIALEGASPKMEERIFANVSERVGQMIKEEMEFLGPVSLSDVEEVRDRILRTLEQLIQRGQVIYPRREGATGSGEQAHPEISFYDLALLTDQECQLLLGEVDAKDLVLATKNTGRAFRHRLLSQAPEQVRQMIRQAQMNDVDIARARITQVAQRLIQTGRVMYPLEAKQQEAQRRQEEDERYGRERQERLDRIARGEKGVPGIIWSSIAGLALGILTVALGIRLGHGLLRPAPAAVFVLIGAVSIVLMTYGLRDALRGFRLAYKVFYNRFTPLNLWIETMVIFAEQARREGILTLEQHLSRISDPFSRTGMQLAIDGVEPEAVQKVLEGEVSCMQERHREGQSLVATAGIGGALFGMIGLLLGLLIAPGRTAFIPLFWGSILVGLCFVLRAMLRQMTAREVLQRHIMIVGIFEIQSGTNPTMLETQLCGMISPRQREAYMNSKQGK